MKSLRFASAALAAASLAIGIGMASAQTAPSGPKPLTISTGGNKGTYYQLVEEIKRYCTNPEITNKSSGGSIDNINAIMTNQAELGITQYDVLFFRARGEEAAISASDKDKKREGVKERIFTLFPLHPEEIHFISKSKPHKEGASSFVGMSFGGKDVNFNTVSDLKGRKIGFWGGSKTTVEVLTNIGFIGWQPMEFKNQDDTLAELAADNIDAIVAVGGQPIPWVDKLGGDYKLLEVPDSLANVLKEVYDRTTLAYGGLGQDGIKSLSVQALLITRNYASQNGISRLKAIRDCVIAKLDDIRDETGTHPKWQSINPSADARWQMFAPAIVPTPAGKKS